MAAFRKGVVAGFAAGYVLGSKAGHERYEQIRKVYRKVTATPAVRRLSEKAAAVVGLGIERGKVVLLDEIEKATHMIRGRVTSSAKTRIFD